MGTPSFTLSARPPPEQSDMSSQHDDVWIFGYGSLIWRPDMEYLESRVARLDGWMRRFWQGSHDHRGVPEAPGRVVTLLQRAGEHCEGVAFRVSGAVAQAIFPALDYREKNGYERHQVRLTLRDTTEIDAVVYIATEDNFAYLGPADANAMAAQIAASVGPSGRNVDYLTELAAALRDLDIHDEHVFELEGLVTLYTGHLPKESLE